MRPILIVDNNPDSLDRLCRAVSDEGADIRAVSSARAAMAILRREPIGGIVTEVLMLEMDGIELVRAARARHGRLPILVLTSDSEVADLYLKAAVAVGATLTGLKGEGELDLLRELLGIVDFRHQITRRDCV